MAIHDSTGCQAEIAPTLPAELVEELEVDCESLRRSLVRGFETAALPIPFDLIQLCVETAQIFVFNVESVEGLSPPALVAAALEWLRKALDDLPKDLAPGPETWQEIRRQLAAWVYQTDLQSGKTKPRFRRLITVGTEPTGLTGEALLNWRRGKAEEDYRASFLSYFGDDWRYQGSLASVTDSSFRLNAYLYKVLFAYADFLLECGEASPDSVLARFETFAEKCREDVLRWKWEPVRRLHDAVPDTQLDCLFRSVWDEVVRKTRDELEAIVWAVASDASSYEAWDEPTNASARIAETPDVEKPQPPPEDNGLWTIEPKLLFELALKASPGLNKRRFAESLGWKLARFNSWYTRHAYKGGSRGDREIRSRLLTIIRVEPK